MASNLLATASNLEENTKGQTKMTSDMVSIGEHNTLGCAKKNTYHGIATRSKDATSNRNCCIKSLLVSWVTLGELLSTPALTPAPNGRA